MEQLTEELTTTSPEPNPVEQIPSKVTPQAPAATEQQRPIQTEVNETVLQPQDCGCGCGGGGNGTLGYVFAVGRIYPAFPSESVQNEYTYAYEEFKAAGPPNALFYQVLSQGQNLYIARQMCWVLQIDGIDTYIVKPRTDTELYHLIASLEPINAGQLKFDVIIGARGPVATPEMCNNLQLPTVACNLSYHFTFSEFVSHVAGSIPEIPSAVVENMLQQMLQVSDNAGETDAHRAINYLMIRSKDIYYMAWQMQNPNPPAPYPPGTYFLQGVTAKPAAVQGNRSIVDVIFQYMSRDTYETAYWYVKVDVTGIYPFLASKQVSRYYPAP